MTVEFLRDLVRQSLFDPRGAASRIMALNLPRDWLWQALALMSIFNAIIYTLSVAASGPMGPEAEMIIPTAFQSPFMMTLFLIGALVITVLTLTWIGQAMGGRGQIRDILALVVWLQVMRLLVQAVLLISVLVFPALGVIVAMVASIWGIAILVCFIDRAHGFDNLLKAAAALILCVVSMVLGLSAILGVLMAAVMGGA
ncbi:Yip1 family protein [Rhodobacteraceae bacterium KMM 6894]|nr:Yip1 family protein [Rhodobacteraceae bacterium KMM 6894]